MPRRLWGADHTHTKGSQEMEQLVRGARRFLEDVELEPSRTVLSQRGRTSPSKGD